MKHCNNCNAYRPDAVNFCTQCGGSFGVRYCRSSKGTHQNPPWAEYCQVCGSPDLSTPHRRARPGLRERAAITAAIATAAASLVVVFQLIRADGAMPPLWMVMVMLGIAIVLAMWNWVRQWS